MALERDYINNSPASCDWCFLSGTASRGWQIDQSFVCRECSITWDATREKLTGASEIEIERYIDKCLMQLSVMAGGSTMRNRSVAVLGQLKKWARYERKCRECGIRCGSETPFMLLGGAPICDRCSRYYEERERNISRAALGRVSTTGMYIDNSAALFEQPPTAPPPVAPKVKEPEPMEFRRPIEFED